MSYKEITHWMLHLKKLRFILQYYYWPVIWGPNIWERYDTKKRTTITNWLVSSSMRRNQFFEIKPYTYLYVIVQLYHKIINLLRLANTLLCSFIILPPISIKQDHHIFRWTKPLCRILGDILLIIVLVQLSFQNYTSGYKKYLGPYNLYFDNYFSLASLSIHNCFLFKNSTLHL